MRSTFEARGYTAWDPTSPAFLLEGEKSKTLVIPSVFLSWTGDVLDIKTPFLRSMRALNDSVMTLQKLLGNRAAKRVKVYGGPEQEYFLFSKDLVKTRPDLEVCGRTLFGTAPAKGQQMEDHYFGSIKEKVLNFMEDLDFELYRRGIPSKTRHNEVSPNQFEVAPLYQEANLAIDNNLQVMTIMQKVADKHGLVAVLHEKPLAGVNGSGKHFNWSIGDNTGENYLSPSKSPLKNINFLVTVGAILLGVKKYGGILRASVADAGNDHRLGANEAPPAIMSVYLGEYLDNLLNEIEGIGKLTQKKMDDINTGVRNLPKLAKDTSDRNRTSPIAFTGNKFEFRAVGSSHNCAEPGTVLNLIVAYGYDEICRRIKANKGADKKTVAIEVLKDVIKETKAVRFEGNNYSDEWHKEAEKRGLINRTNTPSAIELFLDKEVAKLYEKYNVLTEQELHSKVDIKLEAYIKTKEIEYKTAIDIAQTGVLASLALDISRKAKAAKRLKEVAGENAVLTKHIAELSKVYSQISKGIDVLKAALKTCESEKDILKQAHSYAEKGGKALEELRAAVDEAETMISKDLWTMASYQDLLLKL